MPYLMERLQQHYGADSAADFSGAGAASGWHSAPSAGVASGWQEASQAVLARVRLPTDAHSCRNRMETRPLLCSAPAVYLLVAEGAWQLPSAGGVCVARRIAVRRRRCAAAPGAVLFSWRLLPVVQASHGSVSRPRTP